MDLETEIDICYNCDECLKSFPTDSQLHVHKKVVHVKKYKCRYCGHRFGNTSNLKQHLKSRHTETTPVVYPCLFCKETFVRKGLLTEHLRESHPDQKLHSCEDCKKTFFSQMGLKHHTTVVHESKLLFSCPDCSMSFRRESTLERHIDKEHLGLGKESMTYKCDECGKSLPSGCWFHVCKNEVPLTCDECGESFSNTIDFKTHMQTVHKPVKHPCTDCKKSFTSKDLLDAHIQKTHPEKYTELVNIEEQCKIEPALGLGNVKKHKCQLCEIAFARPENLKRHIQRIHKEKL